VQLLSRLLRGPPLTILAIMGSVGLIAMMAIVFVAIAVFDMRPWATDEPASVQQTAGEVVDFPGLGIVVRTNERDLAGVDFLNWGQPVTSLASEAQAAIAPVSGDYMSQLTLLVLAAAMLGWSLTSRKQYQTKISPISPTDRRLREEWRYSTWHNALAMGRVAKAPIDPRRDNSVSSPLRKTV
jgi:hypothetical protein